MSTPRIHTFATPEPIDVDVENACGEIHIRATATSESQVRLTGLRGDGATQRAIEQAIVEFADGRLHVANPSRIRLGLLPSLRIEVTVPDGSSVRVRTASADTRIDGRISSLAVNTASGDVTADDVDGEVRVKSASGDLRVGSVTGDVRARTASGDIWVGCAETVQLNTASGDVTVDELGGSGQISTVSGDQRIGRAGQGDLVLRAVSGDVSVGVAKGALAHLSFNTISGTIRTDLPVTDAAPEHDAVLRITGRTVSGDITVKPARVTQSV